MDEWVHALVAVLEHGIVIEHQRDGSLLVRLAPIVEPTPQTQQQQGNAW